MDVTQNTTTTTPESIGLCGNGLHPRTPDNTGFKANGESFCRPCKRENARKHRRRHQPTGRELPRRVSNGQSYDSAVAERAIAGDYTGVLTVQERREAVRVLASVGYTSNEIATRIGTTARTVERIRSEFRMREHGTYRRYHIGPDEYDRFGCGCRCQACVDAQRAYERRRNRMVAYGEWRPYVDAEPVRQHVLNLSARGFGWQRVAWLAGVSDATVGRLLYGRPSRGEPPPTRVRRHTADRLLALNPDRGLLGDTVSVDGTGTRRRLQALAAVGHGDREVAHRIGVNPSNLTTTRTSGRVYARTARAVRRVFDELWDVTPDGPAADRKRAQAKQRGWVPALGWDDDSIDDPQAEPKAELQRRRRRRRRSPSGGTVAEHFGVAPDEIGRVLRAARR